MMDDPCWLMVTMMVTMMVILLVVLSLLFLLLWLVQGEDEDYVIFTSFVPSPDAYPSNPEFPLPVALLTLLAVMLVRCNLCPTPLGQPREFVKELCGPRSWLL